MATNYTTNYQLNQWEPTDAVQRVEFNADNAKIESPTRAFGVSMETLFKMAEVLEVPVSKLFED